MNETYFGRLPRFPIAMLEIGHFAGSQSLERDQLANCELFKDHQLRTYQLIHEYHMTNTSGISRSNAKLPNTF